MLVSPPLLVGASWETNLSASTRNGFGLTASGTTHTMGSWTALVDPTTAPSYGIMVALLDVGASNANTSMLVDIGYGPTGGGNEVVLLPFLNAGAAAALNTGAVKCFSFPVYIPAGVRVSGRCQSAVVSDAVQCIVWLMQDRTFNVVPGGFVEAYGEVTASSRGTLVTPGNGSFGSWTSLGTTVRDHRFWGLGYDQGGDQSIASTGLAIELGIGPNSGDVTRIFGPVWFGQSNAESIGGGFPLCGYAPVKSGTELWVRIGSSETEQRGVIAYGCD